MKYALAILALLLAGSVACAQESDQGPSLKQLRAQIEEDNYNEPGVEPPPDTDSWVDDVQPPARTKKKVIRRRLPPPPPVDYDSYEDPYVYDDVPPPPKDFDPRNHVRFKHTTPKQVIRKIRRFLDVVDSFIGHLER